jgi:DNA-binding GntR family transcriptional regulator
MAGRSPAPIAAVHHSEPVLPSSMTEYTVGVLRNRIVAGHYPRGSRLDQRRIAKDLGVSIIPLREGLRVLEASGLVNLYPNRGAFVAMLSRSELQEIYLIRQVLDPLATRYAVPRMSEAVLDHLTGVLNETEEVTRRQDLCELHRLNREFHLSIYAQADMPILLQTLTGLRDRYAVYSQLCIAIPNYSARSLDDHREIFELCKAGEGDRAAEYVRRHIESATEELLLHLPCEEELGSPAVDGDGQEGAW